MSLFDNLLGQIIDDPQLASIFAKCIDDMTPEQRARYEAVLLQKDSEVANG
jgi:hypothetical protein